MGELNWNEEVVLITGGTSGLGKALATGAVERGATVILIARSKEKLQDTVSELEKAGGKVFGFDFDLKNIDKIPELFRNINETVNKPVTVLFNNVGYQVAGFVGNTPVSVYEENYRVNTLAPIALIQAVLPGMITRKHGVIGNVMSSIMYHSFPCVSSYTSSKKALGAVHESLKTELTGTGVKTIIIRPGSFRSEYWKNTRVDGRIEKFPSPSGEGQNLPSIPAEGILRAIDAGKESFDLSTWRDKVGYHLSYWAPSVLEKILYSRNRKLIEQNWIKGIENE